MADKYSDRLMSMNGKYRLGQSTFSYIGQVKISHILKGPNFETEFRSLINEVLQVFDIQPPTINVLPFLDNKVDCIAFVTCADNRDHLKIISLFDDRMFRGKRLAAKPNGFTNERYNGADETKYRAQKAMVQLFNTVNYPGSGNAGYTPPSIINHARAHLYTAANNESEWAPPASRKRAHIPRVESIYVIPKSVKNEADEDDTSVGAPLLSNPVSLAPPSLVKQPVDALVEVAQSAVKRPTFSHEFQLFVRKRVDKLVLITIVYFLVFIQSVYDDIPLD